MGMLATQMLKKFRRLLYILPLFFLTTPLIADPLSQMILSNQEVSSTVKEIDKAEKKDLKVLVLIIASDNFQAYLELQKIWRTYMHSDPEHFEVYFIRGDPNLSTPYLFTDDSLIVQIEDGYRPGILNKTLLSMEVFLPRLKEFDYVIRTNLSSFYVFPKLLQVLKTLPREKCYAGVTLIFNNAENAVLNVWGISGAGIIFSTDLVESLIEEKKNLAKYEPEKYGDDVVIACMLKDKAVRFVTLPRVDFQTKEEWINGQARILDSSFHFRAKNNYDFRKSEESFEDELYIDHELLKRYYPTLSKSE